MRNKPEIEKILDVEKEIKMMKIKIYFEEGPEEMICTDDELMLAIRLMDRSNLNWEYVV